MGESEDPLKHAAEDMRDIYANEIARVVSAGEWPALELVRSWQRYSAKADEDVRRSGPAPTGE
ncbi:hypothetical protein LLS1_37550 [Leifsonia sp. LS1]|nr:hypothetical protein LLS1_37550 [Leifsonia sp. LS1]